MLTELSPVHALLAVGAQLCSDAYLSLHEQSILAVVAGII